MPVTTVVGAVVELSVATPTLERLQVPGDGLPISCTLLPEHITNGAPLGSIVGFGFTVSVLVAVHPAGDT